jgi:RNA polymerase sigma-70 factor (ECF subfamily)
MDKEQQARRAWLNSSSRQTGASAASQGERSVVFEAAVLVHLDAAYTLARYLTRRGDAAEDIVQEALLRAYRGFESQSVTNARAWLMAIVRNCFLTWKERSGQNSEMIGFDDVLQYSEVLQNDSETPETILIGRQAARRMRTLIEALPEPFREVLVLRDIEDLSYREIAEIADIPIGTVMSRLARARRMFATAWKGSEFEVPEGKLP